MFDMQSERTTLVLSRSYLLELPHTSLMKLVDTSFRSIVTIAAVEADADALIRVLQSRKWKKYHIEDAIAALRSARDPQKEQKERLLSMYRDTGRVNERM